MKLVLIPILFLFVSVSPNPRLRSIELPKNYKIKSSFSCELKSKSNFHIIIAKNKLNKKFTILPVKADEDHLKLLKSIDFDIMPSVLSYHNNDKSLFLILSFINKKEKEFQVLDIDISSGDFIKSDIIKNPYFKTVIAKKHENLLLFSNGEDLLIKRIKTTDNIEDIFVTPSDKSRGFFRHFNEFGLSSVNTDEFVANGSVKRVKAYCNDEELLITNDNLLGGYSTVLKLPLNGSDFDKVSHTRFDIKLTKLKSMASFYDNGQFYQLCFDKEISTVLVHDINSKNNKRIDLDKISINYKAKDFNTLKTFIKKCKSAVNTPTITINTTTQGNKLVRIDHVDSDNYRYNNNWFFHDMFFQRHQQMFNTQPKFGPINEYNNHFFTLDKEYYFEFLLDVNLNEISEETQETVYPKTDKDKFIKKVKNSKPFAKFESHVFIDFSLYYFYFDEIAKKLFLYETPIK